jgi:hypothetical protein
LVEALLLGAVLVAWFLPVVIAAGDDQPWERTGNSGCLFAISVMLNGAIFWAANLALAKDRVRPGAWILLLPVVAFVLHWGIFYLGSDSFRAWIHSRGKRSPPKKG